MVKTPETKYLRQVYLKNKVVAGEMDSSSRDQQGVGGQDDDSGQVPKVSVKGTVSGDFLATFSLTLL
jgi:hypothetical protein